MIRRHFLPQHYSESDELKVLGQHQGETLGPVIRCLVWNIYKARRSTWLDDFRSLVADRDLTLLQEAVFNTGTDHLFSRSERMQWVMARSFRHPRSLVENGVKTGCIARSVNNEFFLSPHSEPVSQTQKLLLSTEYALSTCEDSLLVLNMHAINFVAMPKYLGQLVQLSAALANHHGPIILAGDFNTWSAARLAHFKAIADNANLQEAAMQRKTRIVHMRKHLDHLYYRGLTLRSVESLAEFQSSDHAPITATFEIS